RSLWSLELESCGDIIEARLLGPHLEGTLLRIGEHVIGISEDLARRDPVRHGRTAAGEDAIARQELGLDPDARRLRGFSRSPAIHVVRIRSEAVDRDALG